MGRRLSISAAVNDREASANGRVRIALFNEFPVFCEALGIAISQEDDLEWVGSATTADEASELIRAGVADVVLIDIDVPLPGDTDVDGIELARLVKSARPDTRVLILSGQMDLDAMARAATEGACGFLSKTSSIKDICTAARTAKDGGIYVEGELIVPLLESVRQSSRRPSRDATTPAQLTARELDVLMLLGEGLDVNVISKRLGITTNTCRGHVKNVLTKLGCHSQLEAVVEAAHQGLLPHLTP